jgi:hypothetical protein
MQTLVIIADDHYTGYCPHCGKLSEMSIDEEELCEGLSMLICDNCDFVLLCHNFDDNCCGQEITRNQATDWVISKNGNADDLLFLGPCEQDYMMVGVIKITRYITNTANVDSVNIMKGADIPGSIDGVRYSGTCTHCDKKYSGNLLQ